MPAGGSGRGVSGSGGRGSGSANMGGPAAGGGGGRSSARTVPAVKPNRPANRKPVVSSNELVKKGLLPASRSQKSISPYQKSTPAKPSAKTKKGWR